MLTRRHLFKSGILAYFSSLFAVPVAVAKPVTLSHIEDGVRVLVDTIVPADEAPGAVDLGIHTMLFSRIRKNANYLEKIRQTIATLDELAVQQSDSSFAQSGADQRLLVVSQVLNSRKQFPEANRQIGSLRVQVLTAFYASDAAFTMLEYHPPSQGGYPDYARPPL